MKDFLNLEEDFFQNKSTIQLESEISDLTINKCNVKLRAKNKEKIKETFKKSLRSIQTFEFKKNIKSFNTLDSVTPQNSPLRDKYKTQKEKEDFQTPILSEGEHSLANIPIKIENKNFLYPNSNFETETDLELKKNRSKKGLHVTYDRNCDRSKTMQPRKSQLLFEMPLKIDL